MAILILMDVEGEAKEIAKSYDADRCFDPENEENFKTKLAELVDEDVYEACKQGCLRLASDFDRKELAKRMMESIKKCV